MKILLKDIRRGILKLVPTNRDDLWLLSQVINRHALVSSKTTRKIKLSETKVEKKTYYLQIMVEKVELEEELLRLNGRVESEVEDIPKGSYHSLNIGLNDDLKIEQKWLRYQIDKIEESTKERLSILLVVLDRESVYFAKLQEQGYKVLANFEGDVEKKHEGLAAKGGFYKQVGKKLKEYDERFKLDRVVIGSPAFFKEDFMKELDDAWLKKKITLATCSSVSENAFGEILKRDEIKNTLQQARIQEELELVDRLFGAIGKGRKFCYGLNEVKEKANSGAVEILLVSSGLIGKYREEDKFEDLEGIMLIVEQTKGKVVIVDSKNEAGKRLDGISGIAGILRY